MNVKLTFEVNINQPQTIQEAIDTLYMLLQTKQGKLNSANVAIMIAESEEKTLAEQVKTTTQAVAIPAATTEAADEVIKLSLDTLRQKTQARILAGHRAAIKAKLDEYKAKNVSSVPEDKFEDFNNFLETLAIP